jgi:RNA polymerase sigma factor (sigma-70 family)
MDLASQLGELQREIERSGGELGEDLFGEVACALLRMRVDWSCPQQAHIRRVAQRRRVDLVRRQAIRSHESLEALGEVLENATGPSNDFENQQERDQLRTAIARLKPKYSRVVQLVYLDGLDEQEAARLLCVPRETVRTRLKRAVKQLRQCFSHPSGVQ